ncbi:H-NS family nucleoid-associated regulatory protein [Massilia sp. TWR1-2-2]|uniref:H-NS histone family protein n=1 Tax=Massilia sp. TWR1-2-2 TaxID=2804584 RepID=UPI003CEFA60D
MDEYLDLNRRFGLLTNYTGDELLVSDAFGRRLTWTKVLEGRFTVIVGRANFGKTTELKAKSTALRAQQQSSFYVALHKILGEDNFEDSLEVDDRAALFAWRQSGGELTVFVDSLDEASLGTEDGIQRALRRLSRALCWPNANIKWVLSSRPAVLTEDVLALLQAEFQTTMYRGVRNDSSDEGEIDTAFAEGYLSAQNEKDGDLDMADDLVQGDTDSSISDVESTDVAGKTENKVPELEQLKVYALLPLDKAAAALYLGEHLGMSQPKQTLSAAWKYGLGRLAEGPGGLDIMGYIDPVRKPPEYLTQVFEKMVEAVQQQQRADPRERRVGSPPPESLEEAIERLASASVICQLPNIEISGQTLRFREGVLSARPLIASLLSEQSLSYLLGSRLFIDSGQHQVKLYPDELLPFLAAKRLASLVKSPEHARRLLVNLTWHSTTGECGVYRALFPLAGWLSVFSAHCRQELIRVEPQVVAFFGDLRNPNLQIAEAAGALEGAIERLVCAGDTLGRRYYTLSAENFWQAAKPGVEPTLKKIFDKYGADLHAREALLDIASHARLEIFRESVLDGHDRDYGKLLDAGLDLDYILFLERADDFCALGTALRTKVGLSEARTARLISALAWKAIDAKFIAMIAAEQFRMGRGGYSIDWALTGDIAAEASNVDLYRLTRSLLLRLVNFEARPGRSSERYWADQKFVELVMDLLAMVIARSAVEPSRAAKFCLVLGRILKDRNHTNADTTRLRKALNANKAVRLSLLRGLVHPTDKTANGIYQAVFAYHRIYPHVEGDERELEEPGFAELLNTLQKQRAIPPSRPARQRNEAPVVDKKSKATLIAKLDELRDASDESALAWVAQWLNRTVQQSRYGECNFALFEKAAGSDIADAVREGLSSLWRTKNPTWKEDAPNSTYNITIAGLQGLHLDLGDGSRLPAMSEQEVVRAVRYSQFEINGYPKWFWSVVRAHEQVALHELCITLSNASTGIVSLEKAETLIRHLKEAPQGVQQSLARPAWDILLSNPQFNDHTSESALRLATATTGVIDQATFEAEAWRRMGSAFDEEIPSLADSWDMADVEAHKARQAVEARIRELTRQRENAVVWGRFWLWTYPGDFTQRWESWRASNPQAAEGFMFALAAHLGEDRVSLNQVAEQGSDGLTALKLLYEWVHSVVRVADDIKHEDGGVYSPSERDHAQRLRDTLIPAISHAKSELAYKILEEIRQGSIGATAKYLRHVQFMMREEQNAKKPVTQGDYPEFERSFAPPVSDYMTFAMAVESDLLTVKNEIETGDFSLRRFFNSVNFKRIKTDNDGLALEEDFQALLGSELNHAAGTRYAVTLESILPEGTRRDVLCQTGSLRATVELKMSFRWTLADYMEALEKQLQGQYMMAQNSKIGFFVVVHQEERTWDGPDGNRIGFDEVIGILQRKAREKEIADSGLYLRVIGINATPKEKFRSVQSASTAAGDSIAPKYADGAGNFWSGRGRNPRWMKDALASGKLLDDLLAAKT